MRSIRTTSSASAALPVAVAHFLVYGGPIYFFISLPVGLISGVVSFVIALGLSYVYLPLRKRIGRFQYFLIHVFGGLVIGIVYALSTGHTDSIHELFFSRHTSYGVFGSVNAWLFLLLADLSSVERHIPAYGVVLVAGVAMGIASKSLEYPEDDSCHNSLRGNRGSISPVLRVKLTLPAEAEGRLRDLYMDFSRRNSLSERFHPIYTEVQPSSLCNDYIEISISGFFEGRHSAIFYEPNPGSNWRMLARDLVCEFKTRWPGSVQYTGDGGEKVKEPDYLASSCAGG